VVEPPTLLTVGHSNQSMQEFLALLHAHDVQGIADVRSWPVSRYTPWFDRERLAVALPAAGIQYVFLGRELGGRPDDERLYDEDGRVQYDAVANTERFARGLRKLRHGVGRLRIAAMCAEEDPEHCHRRLLVARVLFMDGVRVSHIRRNAGLEPEVGFARPDSLFEEPLPWRSTASVLRRPQPSVSSVA
jgi:uncharacterized protein (DUF488 family)